MPSCSAPLPAHLPAPKKDKYEKKKKKNGTMEASGAPLIDTQHRAARLLRTAERRKNQRITRE